MKKFVLNKTQETMAVIMAGAMLFGNPHPFLPEERFVLSVEESQEDDYSRTLSRKKNSNGVKTFGKHIGYTRKPRNGFGRPNTPFSMRNEE